MIKDPRAVHKKVEKLLDPEVTIDEVKEIVCAFYKNGKNPQCRGCLQPDDVVEACKREYLLRIEAKPMEVWSKEFDEVKVRQKKPLSEILNIGLACNRCHLSDSCPVYELDALCGIDWEEDIDGKDPKALMDKLIKIQFKRVNRTSKIEELEGGVVDQNLSGELDRLDRLIANRQNMNYDRLNISLSASQQSGGLAGDSKPSLLASLFGVSSKKTLPEPDTTLDIPHVEVSSKELKKEQKET